MSSTCLNRADEERVAAAGECPKAPSHTTYIPVSGQAYDQIAPAAQPFIAFVSLYSGPKKIYETKPIEVTSGSNDRLRTTPIQFSLALGDLAPGKYDCQVTILEPTGQKAAFWQAPIMLVP